MSAWWESLDGLTRALYGVALFFSVLFVWQLAATLLGLGGDAADDADATDGDFSDAGDDAVETMTAFRLLSIRSIITFLTLFSWGGALYLSDGRSARYAIGVSSLWGLFGMLCVAGLLYVLPRLAHTGTKNMASAVGASGQVYLDIPENGDGEVRVNVSGIVSYVKARAKDGQALKAGTPVVVARRLSSTLLEVERINESKTQGGSS